MQTVIVIDKTIFSQRNN